MKITDLITITKRRVYLGRRRGVVFTAHCGEVTCQAPTAAEAMEAIRQVILHRLGMHVEPEVVRAGNVVYVAYQENNGGWSYSIDGRTVCSRMESRDACVRLMRVHAGQNAYTPGEDDYAAAAALVDRRDLYDFARWCDWQNRYHEAKTRGLSDDEARAAADPWPSPSIWPPGGQGVIDND